MSCTNSILYSKDKTESAELADIVASSHSFLKPGLNEIIHS